MPSSHKAASEEHEAALSSQDCTIQDYSRKSLCIFYRQPCLVPLQRYWSRADDWRFGLIHQKTDNEQNFPRIIIRTFANFGIKYQNGRPLKTMLRLQLAHRLEGNAGLPWDNGRATLQVKNMKWVVGTILCRMGLSCVENWARICMRRQAIIFMKI